MLLYALFGLSVFCPVYTYALYPLVLKCLPEKHYKTDFDNAESNSVKALNTLVTVIVVGKNGKAKAETIKQTGIDTIWAAQISDSINKTAKGEIIVFTDDKTELDKDAIGEIIKPFADERIGCVVGQQTNPEGNSTFWKYENTVKRLESRIGCVSGATASIFAVRKKDFPQVPETVINKPFYIATTIAQAGKDIVYQPSAKAYEGKDEGTNFDKHVQDAAGYWQALRLFPKMLLPISKGSFVYISHRVMKWFVWLNMVFALVTSGLLALLGSMLMALLFWLQIYGYIFVILLGKRNLGTLLGKLISIGYYFVMLNISYFTGFFGYEGEKTG